MNKKQKAHKTIVPGNPNAVNVVGTQREDLGYALKAWKRKIKISGVLEEVKNNKTFVKPSVARREQLISARYLQKIKDLHRDN
jgi:small subunit ribosomal protein S21